MKLKNIENNWLVSISYFFEAIIHSKNDQYTCVDDYRTLLDSFVEVYNTLNQYV